MTLKDDVLRYIGKASRIFDELQIDYQNTLVDKESVREVIAKAKRYFNDARYFLEEKKHGTALTSISYCEGILDALRLVGLVEFSWDEEKDGSRKDKIVLAKGTFDLLHYGHIFYLREAKKTGGKDAVLKVVIARDKTVKKLKGEKPVIPEKQRLAIVSSLRVVDDVFLGYEEIDMKQVIKEVQPNIIALGYDQEILENKLLEYIRDEGLDIEIVRVGKFQEGDEPSSSSKIKRQIIENYGK